MRETRNVSFIFHSTCLIISHYVFLLDLNSMKFVYSLKGKMAVKISVPVKVIGTSCFSIILGVNWNESIALLH